MQAPRHTGKGGITNWLKEGETVQERRTRLAIIEVIKKDKSSAKGQHGTVKVSS